MARAVGVQVPPSTFDFLEPSKLGSILVFKSIGFQDNLDAFILAMMPCCWEFEADL